MDTNNPTVIYILGGPGSGKGTQCKAILDNFPNKFYHISTGSLLREATLQPTPEHAFIIECMKSGKMVPSKYLIELIKERINKIGNKVVYILDGFPRNTQNIEVWNQVIKNDVDVKYLLYFKCTEQQMRKRLLNRAKTSGRVDDNSQTIEKRIKIFNEETQKMLQNFNKQAGYVVQIDANRTPEEITKSVIEVLFSHNTIE